MNLDQAISEDWHHQNRAGLCRALCRAYLDTNATCDVTKNPFFETPNRVYALGYNRWVISAYWLDQACKNGWITGITPVWVSHTKSTGPIKTLELRGTHTTLTVLHLPSPDAPARDSRLRYDHRVNNERCPYLIGLEADAMAGGTGPVNLVLVHGDKEPEFAILRVYNDPNDLNSFRDVTGNLFEGGATITRIDDEEIPDVRIDIIPPELEDEDDLGSAGGK